MKYIYTFFCVLLATTLLLTLNSYSSGPGQAASVARTGAPGEGNCTSCHASSTANYSSAAMSVQVRDALNNVVTSYTPGQTYTIAMQMSGVRQPNVTINPQFGGQLTVLKSINNTIAGSLSAPSTGARVLTVGTKSYLEHTQRSATGLWTATWTAPIAGTGSINLYGYGLAISGSGTSGDLGAGTTVTLSEATTSTCNVSVTRTVTNATCFGACNGSISVAATGGTAPYTFRMANNTANTNNVFTNLCAGSYTITATDANGCSAIITASVTQPTAITVSTSSTAAVGTQANGSATASAAGGTAPYSYSWGAGSSGATRTGLVAGTYIVTVFDANQCSATASVVVSATQAPCNISVTRTVINASCFGACNGSISVAATGGTAPYTFRMANNTANPNNVFTNLCAGSYTITATDANGCSAIIIASVTQPTAITVSTSSTAAVGTQANGSATASASGGTAPYSYAWGTSASGATRTGLVAGTYIVTVFDANQCSATASVVVSATQAPCNVSVTRTVTNAGCFGVCNGSISVAATGGTAPYTFRMLNNTASPNNVFTNLCAGNYTITATDSNGCSAIITASVTQPTAINVSTSSTAAVGTQANGSATASASGGTAPYSYAWGTSASGATRTGLVAGTYIVTVFDANQCSATASVVVSATQAPCNISVTRTVTNAGCFGVCNGSISVAATGGTAPYTFRMGTSVANPNNAFTNLCAGGYAITATDANGCSAIITATVTQPTAITVSTSSTAAVGTQANGSATASASGGTAPYTYAWGTSTSGATRTGLVAGTYIVTVFDANQCSATASVVVSATQAPCNISVTRTVTNVNCFGDCNGSISVAATGGTAPYVFRMLNNTANPNNVFTNLCTGNYTITATDANGCSAIVTASVTQPTAITVNISTNNATNSQSNGSALANASGGTPSYFYSWSNGAFNSAATGLAAGVYTVTVFDARQCQATASAVVSATQAVCNVSLTRTVTNVNCFGACNGSITVAATGGRSPYIYRMGTSVANANNVFTNLCAGGYAITATDANGCTAIVTASVTQPTAITVSTSSTAAVGTQANGSATASASGGTAPYSFSWGAGSSGASRTGLVAGTYIVTVFDANQCSASASVVVSATQAPCNVSVTRTVTNTTCFGVCNGSISVAATGGTAPYTFRMLNNTASPNNVFTNLCAGGYAITATDANGCSAIITASVTQPSPVNITVTSSGEINCNNTSVVLTATGASTYLWNSSNTSNTLAVTAPGVYSVIGTSQNGCTGSGTVTVTSNRTLPAAFQATSNQAYTNANFPATITIANFNPNLYTYRLVDFTTGVVIATFTSGSMTNVTGGTFMVQCISNTNGCSSFSNRIKVIFDPNYGLISTTSGGGIVNRQSNGSNTTKRLIDGEILVFPNPANDVLKISYNLESDTEATFSIYSTDGRLVWEQKTNGSSDQLQVDASTFVNGQYFLRVVSKDFSEVKTIQILR